MEAIVKTRWFSQGLILFLAAPLSLLWMGGNPAGRPIYMVALSALTVLGFSLLVAQFYLSRGNRGLVREAKMKRVLPLHKLVGYSFALVLLLHPLFVLVPRALGGGADFEGSFVRLLTTVSLGSLSGELAWLCLLALLLTSYFRDKLPMKYRSWRLLHGILSVVFLLSALLHAVKFGRHFSAVVAIFFVGLSAIGLFYYRRALQGRPGKEV